MMLIRRQVTHHLHHPRLMGSGHVGEPAAALGVNFTQKVRYRAQAFG